jgi:DNA (cytosine-5)-methyltransferase 1
MGYPDSFQIPVSDTQAYRQFGNSVVMPVIKAIAGHMSPHLEIILANEKSAQKPLLSVPELAEVD